jgi:hypothetical protein
MPQRRYAVASAGSKIWHVVYFFGGALRTVCGRVVRIPPWVGKGIWRDTEIARYGRLVCGSCARMQDADTFNAAHGKVRS